MFPRHPSPCPPPLTPSADAGMFFGRATGVWMLTVTTSPWWAGMDKSVLCKLFLPINIYLTPLFYYCSTLSTTGPGVDALLPINMWIPQAVLSLGFLVLNILVVRDTPKNNRAMF